MSDPVTRAPWATNKPTSGVLPSSLQGFAPSTHAPAHPSAASSSGEIGAPGTASAGLNLTRAPWAMDNSLMSGGTKAPWSQGIPMPGNGNVPTQKIDFNTFNEQHQDYITTLPAKQSTASESSSAASTTPSTASTASTPSLRYSPPCKLIKIPPYLTLWKRTNAYHEYTSFILLLNERIRGMKVKPEGMPSRKYSISPKVQCVINWLNECKQIISTIPPIQQAMRYGNAAFRTWHQSCLSMEKLTVMLKDVLGDELVQLGADKELVPYLQDAFGSLQRIDYGTGHEMNFVLFLCALYKLKVFGFDDEIALVLEVFRSYILLMQELQVTYWLEPAGSKGAWGLDDYCFLPFLWGSSQLIGSTIQPGDILKEDVLENHKDSYLYLLAIKFIHKVKRGPFYEHSAYLHQISQLPHWQKANSGLIKMYEEEVLNKFPIVQHVLFGRILQFSPYHPGEPLAVTPSIQRLEQAHKSKTQPPSSTGTSEGAQPEQGKAE